MEKIEENVIVLDYLPEGKSNRPPFKRESAKRETVRKSPKMPTSRSIK